MSLMLLSMARKTRGLSPTTKLVLMLICDHADQDHRCWPSVRLLAEDVGITPRNIQKHIATLEELGVLVKDLRPGTTNMFTLVVPAQTPDVGDTPDAGDTRRVRQGGDVESDTLIVKEPSTSPYQEENTNSEVEVEGQDPPDRTEIEEAVRKLAAAGLMDEEAAMQAVREQLTGGEPSAEPEPEPTDGGATLRDQLPSGFAKDQAEFDAKVDSGERPEGWSDDGDQGRWV